MADRYFLLIRTFWMGSLWSALYVVKPILSRWGFFPDHGLEILHWTMGLGLGAGLLIYGTALALFRGVITSWSLNLVLVMTLFSFCYFGLNPWWKVQLIIGHTVSALGLVWCMSSPDRVLAAADQEIL